MRLMFAAAKCFAVLGLVGGIAASAPGSVWGQSAESDYPNKQVRFLVPFSTGGSTDLVARLFAEKLSEKWGQDIIVDNRPGAGGSIGGQALVTADPDGYTLMVTNPGPSMLSVMLRKDAPYEPKDHTPVVYIGSAPLIIVANPDFEPDNASELVEYARENPGKVHWGSSGTNSNPHVSLEVFKHVTDTDIVHVPYKGSGPALTDVVAGTIHTSYTTTVTADGLIKSGDVKVLAVAGANRQEVISDVPTLTEQGIEGANAIVWIGMVAPPGTPQEIIDKVNRDMNEAMQLQDVQNMFKKLGLEPVGGSSAEFASFVDSEVERVNQLIEAGALEPQ